jgi:hypothetical protein
LAELGTDVIEVFRPPAGYRFRRGVVLTHNCSWEHVTDTIAPALAGCEDRSPLVRRRSAQAMAGMHLLVVADGHESAGGPGHTWARLVRAGGRRQHAKVGLLEFSSSKGHRLVRSYVASANLTPSGTARNRELLVVDEQGAAATAPSLVADVAGALAVAIKHLEVPGPHRRELRASVAAIRKGLKAGPTGALVHSLDKPRSLLDALGAPCVAKRVVVISPAFAAASDAGVAAALAPWIASGTEVTLITQCGDDGVLRFSEAALAELRRLAGARNVAVRAVPLDTEGGEPGPPRRLHAKLVAVVSGDNARVLVGSANFSSPGLLGSNREAVVALTMSSAELDDLLGEVPHHPHRGPVGKQLSAAWDDTSPVPPVVASFEPDPTVPIAPDNLIGWLHIDSGGLDVVQVVYDGNVLADWRRHPIAVRDDVGFITVVVDLDGDEVAIEVPLELRLTDEQLAEWPTREGSEPLTDLERLLGTIRVTARSPRDPSAPGMPASWGNGDDKLVIPLQQRLVLLARYRPQVAPLFRAYWHSDRQRLSRLLEPDELRLATALFGLDEEPPSALLRSLAGAADALQQMRAAP